MLPNKDSKLAPAIPWDMDALYSVPEIHEDLEHREEGVKSLFYNGLNWKGMPTKVFAWYGIPEVCPGRKVPGMVLVHGGGGSAFASWVKLWVSRGYAAIAMDTCGCICGDGHNNHLRHERGGPPGWGGFDQVDEPVQDQWSFHAVADVVLAHSLLCSFPEVDAGKTGLTGISWGGYLACIAAGIDARFKFAAPVYGCGFIGENSTWLDTFSKMGPEKARRWLDLWDPSMYLPSAQMPMLWVTGTNDFAYPMDSLKKSYKLPEGKSTLCVRVNMPHGHGGAGENPAEIHAMADALLKDGVPLPEIKGLYRDGLNAGVSFAGKTRALSAELNYTTDYGKWPERVWKTIPATLNKDASDASARLPAETKVYYFNITDERNLSVSSEHEEFNTET